MTMNRLSGINNTVARTCNYVDFIFSNSSRVTIRHNLYQRLPTTDSTGHIHWDKHKLQYVNTPKEVFGKYICVTDVNFSSINQNSSELSYVKSQICRSYHIKLVSALKHPTDWNKKWHKCLCELTGRKLHSSQQVHTVDCNLKKQSLW